jgi:hypothetical protein
MDRYRAGGTPLKRKTTSASRARTETGRRRSSARRKRQPPRKGGYGPAFFLILGVTIASAVGFMGVVASVLAGS